MTIDLANNPFYLVDKTTEQVLKENEILKSNQRSYIGIMVIVLGISIVTVLIMADRQAREKKEQNDWVNF